MLSQLAKAIGHTQARLYPVESLPDSTVRNTLSMSFATHTWPDKSLTFISSWVLPLGYFCLLTGLAWLDERSQYHKLFYALLAAPALIAFLIHPKQIAGLFKNPVVLAFLAFSSWALFSFSWSAAEDSFGSQAKRPLYILMLFMATFIIVKHSWQRFISVLSLAALTILPIALYALADFTLNYTDGARLVGSGALDNPLLSSHLFGIFFILWLGYAMTASYNKSLLTLPALALLLATLLATGSRTPLLAIAFACGWLAISLWNRRALLLVALCTCTGIALLIIYPELILNRGTSYRFEIWQFALEQISIHPWAGHGLGSPLAIPVPELNSVFSEPHSFFLGTLYYTGVIGAIFWLSMHAFALWACWKNRAAPYFAVAGALVIYGLGAGLTEGGGILSRPKEHWFLIWIPLALVIAVNTQHKLGQR